MNFTAENSTALDVTSLCRDHAFAEALTICLWANYWSHRTITATENSFGLNRDDCNVLITLWRYRQLTASEIAQLNGRPKNSIGRAVKRLTEKKLAQIHADRVDSRKKNLRLTADGLTMMERLKPIFIDRQEDMLSRLDKNQRKIVRDLLFKTFVDLPTWQVD